MSVLNHITHPHIGQVVDHAGFRGRIIELYSENMVTVRMYRDNGSVNGDITVDYHDLTEWK